MIFNNPLRLLKKKFKTFYQKRAISLLKILILNWVRVKPRTLIQHSKLKLIP